MHELSLCRGLLQQVNTLAAEHAADSVSRVTLRIGPLAGVEIPLLESAFDVARKNSSAANAELVIEQAPLRIRCEACDQQFDATLPKLGCPQCGSEHTSLISGDELLLVSVAFGDAGDGNA